MASIASVCPTSKLRSCAPMPFGLSCGLGRLERADKVWDRIRLQELFAANVSGFVLTHEWIELPGHGSNTGLAGLKPHAFNGKADRMPVPKFSADRCDSEMGARDVYI